VLRISHFTEEMPLTDALVALRLSGEPLPWVLGEEFLLSGCEASVGILKLYKPNPQETPNETVFAFAALKRRKMQPACASECISQWLVRT